MGKKYKFMPTKEYLEKLYFGEKLTYQQIAQRHDINAVSVHYWFKKFGIKPRKASDYPKRELSEAERAEISLRHKGKHVSPETRKKIAEARRLKSPTGHKKVRDDGYISVYAPEHPNSNSEGYIMEHRLVMEQNIGRHLMPDEVVHHKNRIKSDNEISNLQLMTFKAHAAMHMAERRKNYEL